VRRTGAVGGRPVLARVAVSKGVAVSKKRTSPRRGVPSAGTLVLGKATPRQRKKVPVTREYVGIDLHRRRSVIIRKNAEGELLAKVHIDNDPLAMAQVVAAAGPEPEVVLEATFGWYWAADLLAEMGAHVHLAHPLGNNWGNRRVKNDLLTALIWSICCVWDGWPRRGLPRPRSESFARWSVTATSWFGCARD
jgi:hypothetical protein